MFKKWMVAVFIFIFGSAVLLSAGLFDSADKKENTFFLAGTEKGLYLYNSKKEAKLIWSGGLVKKILIASNSYYFLTSSGILYSKDLKEFNYSNEGLHTKTLKLYRNNEKFFTNEMEDLKDLKADPDNPNNLITCSKQGVYFTTNGGLNWIYLTNPAAGLGIKSVVILSKPDLQIYIGLPFKGVYYKNLTRNSGWMDRSAGMMAYSKANEEVSDMVADSKDGKITLYAANNFSPNIYTFNSKTLKWENIWKSNEKYGMLESISVQSNAITFVGTTNVMKLEEGASNALSVDISAFKTDFESKAGNNLECFCAVKNGQTEYNISELWLLSEPKTNATVTAASGKKGIYVSAGYVRNPQKLDALVKFMEENGLNMMTIDMKDDWGKIRFKPESELLKKMAQTSAPIDIEGFTAKMKEKGIYVVARLVLFQDRVLYSYNNFENAVKDYKGGPWQGVKKGKDGQPKKILEYWVDPYSEKAWEYNVEIAKELSSRGFNEVQFDYVRFPTDGDNLDQTVFSFKDKGMDKESAIMSFLSYARENISIPISIDIYGANGWWRTAARTGQDVELFRRYVDAVCPMYYPSHFDNGFLNYAPFEERPWRIYYYGSLRTYYIARKSIVIRPWVQAFNLHTGYDMKYYGSDYIAQEIKGVDEGLNLGYSFWNMGVKYELLPQAYKKLAAVN